MITFTLRVKAKGSSPLALSRQGHVPGPAVNVIHNKGFPKASYQSVQAVTCAGCPSPGTGEGAPRRCSASLRDDGRMRGLDQAQPVEFVPSPSPDARCGLRSATHAVLSRTGRGTGQHQRGLVLCEWLDRPVCSRHSLRLSEVVRSHRARPTARRHC